MAQLDIIVLPFALTAARIAFSVAPTEIKGNLIIFPFNPFLAVACMYPFFILIFAPSFSKANKCKLTGLAPIAHPPGSETFGFLYLIQ